MISLSFCLVFLSQRVIVGISLEGFEEGGMDFWSSLGRIECFIDKIDSSFENSDSSFDNSDSSFENSDSSFKKIESFFGIIESSLEIFLFSFDKTWSSVIFLSSFGKSAKEAWKIDSSDLITEAMKELRSSRGMRDVREERIEDDMNNGCKEKILWDERIDGIWD